MKELSLFTGMGGGIYGSKILGWTTIAYVDKDKYCQSIIKQRQQDGWFDRGEIYGEISEFNQKHAKKYSRKIDVLTGGFPCQPFSLAGKRKGTSDERYLFNEIIKTIEIIRPCWLFFENVAGILASNAVIEIYKSLDKIGYRCKPPLVLGSSSCGNIHKRERVWIYAIHDSDNRSKRIQRDKPQKVQGKQTFQRCENIRSIEELLVRPDIPEPFLRRMDDEFPNWKQQLKAIGNGQDPIVMATAWQLLDGIERGEI